MVNFVFLENRLTYQAASVQNFGDVSSSFFLTLHSIILIDQQLVYSGTLFPEERSQLGMYIVEVRVPNNKIDLLNCRPPSRSDWALRPFGPPTPLRKARHDAYSHPEQNGLPPLITSPARRAAEGKVTLLRYHCPGGARAFPRVILLLLVYTYKQDPQFSRCVVLESILINSFVICKVVKKQSPEFKFQ